MPLFGCHDGVGVTFPSGRGIEASTPRTIPQPSSAGVSPGRDHDNGCSSSGQEDSCGSVDSAMQAQLTLLGSTESSEARPESESLAGAVEAHHSVDHPRHKTYDLDMACSSDSEDESCGDIGPSITASVDGDADVKSDKLPDGATISSEEILSLEEIIARNVEDKDILSPRQYQLQLFERAKRQNVIACLDTGSGKTFIGVMLLQHMCTEELRRCGMLPGLQSIAGPKRRRSLFIVNLVPLVHQQAQGESRIGT